VERLTSNQIKDFNNPLAFARPRTLRAGQSDLDARSQRTLRTGDIEESYRLVNGAAERLETLAGNLETMLGLARDGQRVRGDRRKLEEIYGRLRSLSAGFDQVVEAIRFKGTTVFDGKPLALSLGAGARPITLEASKLLTYGEDSLDLSRSNPTAEISIRYGVDDAILNKSYNLVGLELETPEYIEDSNSALELEDGKYKIKTTYLGANSSVEIFSEEGALIERQNGVDLSGDGREWVDFDVGIRVPFAKEQLLQSFDKYDFESNGPAYLNATMFYERKESHTLRTEELDDTPDAATFRFDPVLGSDGGGTLKASNPRIGPVRNGSNALESGAYTIDIEYLGENSYARLTDSLGRLRGYQFDLDLSHSGRTQVDFGVGLTFQIDNDNFNGSGGLSIPVAYTRKPPAIDTFDFREYADRIEAAIEVVREERIAMEEAKTEIEEVNNLRNSANSRSVPNAQTLAGSGALNILAQPAGPAGLFDPAAASARTGLLANQLFATTTAFPTQANQSPEALASLQQSTAADFLGAFA